MKKYLPYLIVDSAFFFQYRYRCADAAEYNFHIGR